MSKDVGQLSDVDIAEYPVWEFLTDRDERSDTEVVPVTSLPVSHLIGRLVGTRLCLASGDEWPALLGNVDLQDSDFNLYFMSVIFLKRESQLLYSMDREVGGSPQAVAQFLGRRIEEVFPATYDISPQCTGSERSLRGRVLLEAPAQLSLEDRISWLMRRSKRDLAILSSEA